MSTLRKLWRALADWARRDYEASDVGGGDRPWSVSQSNLRPVPRIPRVSAPWLLYSEGGSFGGTAMSFTQALAGAAACGYYIFNVETGKWYDSTGRVIER